MNTTKKCVLLASLLGLAKARQKTPSAPSYVTGVLANTRFVGDKSATSEFDAFRRAASGRADNQWSEVLGDWIGTAPSAFKENMFTYTVERKTINRTKNNGEIVQRVVDTKGEIAFFTGPTDEPFIQDLDLNPDCDCGYEDIAAAYVTFK
jgi:predicted small secreted protein